MTAEAVATINTKVSALDKALFVQISENLGLTPSAALKVFVRKFNECGGFPFQVVSGSRGVRVPLSRVYEPERSAEGRPILPASWDDPEDAAYDDFA